MEKKNNVQDWMRMHVLYHGRVQGVGFRFNTETIALECGVTGWVKNIPDGGVEVVAEGPKPKLSLFLDNIRKSKLGSYISTEKIAYSDSQNEYVDFCIEYDY
ncbi:MAG: acylphosphatase [Candidatus Omnitrophota bacterium]